MEYQVIKTSIWDDKKKPCPEAVRMIVPDYETRTCTEEEFDRRFSGNEGAWRSIGTEHSITDEGYIKRRRKDKEVWGVEINTMEQLNKFIENNGDIIVSIGCIEIYDTYRE